MFPNKLEFMFYHYAYIFIFKFWNSALPNSVLFPFFIVHTFLETWLLDCVSMPTLTSTISGESFFFILGKWFVIFGVKQCKSMTLRIV